ncbi:hypothetical protein [Neobacillus niacini]
MRGSSKLNSFDLYDWIGAGICLVDVSVMIFAPRQ